MTDFSSTTSSRAPRDAGTFKEASLDKRSEFAQLAGLLMLVLFAVGVLVAAAWAYHDQQALMGWMSTTWAKAHGMMVQAHVHVGEWLAAKPAPSAAVLSDVPKVAEAARAVTNQCAGATPEAARLHEAIVGMTDGVLGKMLALTMLLMGGAVAVAKATPMPAITGMAGACMFSFGPSVLLGVMGC